MTNTIIQVKSIIRLLRPYQWIKNLLLFSPLFFAGNIVSIALIKTSAAAVVFCLASGIGYIVNDWFDREKDQFHPHKKNRPFCTGAVSGKSALFIIMIMVVLLVSLFPLFELSLLFMFYTIAYLIITLSYSFHFKSVPILEIFAVAMGFVLRVLAGGAVSEIIVSSWLFLTVFFIALMISIAKRVNEHKELGADTAAMHRNSQSAYSEIYLNNMLWSSGGVTLVVYALYAVERSPLVMLSVIPATYGIFRFLYLTDQGKGSDPIKTLFSDYQLLLTTIIFFSFLLIVIYI